MAFAIIEPVTLPEAEKNEVQQLLDLMAAGGAVLVSPSGQQRPIPDEVHALFLQVLDGLRDGKAISVVPHGQQLTTQEAANLLGMSRQYLVRLVDANEIPCHKVGTHRRIFLKDLLKYKKQRDARRSQVLTDLARESMELGLYGDE